MFGYTMSIQISLLYDFQKHSLTTAIKNFLVQDLLGFLTNLILNFPHSLYVKGPQNYL